MTKPEQPSQPDPQRSTPHQPEEQQFIEFGPAPWRLTVRTPAWRPPTDVFELEDTIVVRVEIAGMREEDFLIQLDGRYLSIRGVRPDVPERRAYHQMEIRFGEFMIDLELPAPVDANAVQAVYENGWLRVVLPKARSRHIPIRE